tara:strand:+ start:7680 stop:8447 length:768 start_codon:yes stop_codon:yes gene_type:complete
LVFLNATFSQSCTPKLVLSRREQNFYLRADLLPYHGFYKLDERSEFVSGAQEVELNISQAGKAIKGNRKVYKAPCMTNRQFESSNSMSLPITEQRHESTDHGVVPSFQAAEFVQFEQQQGRLCPDLTADKTECHKAADCFESVPIPRLCGQKMADISHSREINPMTANDVSVYCIAYFSWKLKKWRLDIVARCFASSASRRDVAAHFTYIAFVSIRDTPPPAFASLDPFLVMLCIAICLLDGSGSIELLFECCRV